MTAPRAEYMFRQTLRPETRPLRKPRENKTVSIHRKPMHNDHSENGWTNAPRQVADSVFFSSLRDHDAQPIGGAWDQTPLKQAQAGRWIGANRANSDVYFHSSLRDWGGHPDDSKRWEHAAVPLQPKGAHGLRPNHVWKAINGEPLNAWRRISNTEAHEIFSGSLRSSNSSNNSNAKDSSWT